MREVGEVGPGGLPSPVRAVAREADGGERPPRARDGRRGALHRRIGRVRALRQGRRGAQEARSVAVSDVQVLARTHLPRVAIGVALAALRFPAGHVAVLVCEAEVSALDVAAREAVLDSATVPDGALRECGSDLARVAEDAARGVRGGVRGVRGTLGVVGIRLGVVILRRSVVRGRRVRIRSVGVGRRLRSVVDDDGRRRADEEVLEPLPERDVHGSLVVEREAIDPARGDQLRVQAAPCEVPLPAVGRRAKARIPAPALLGVARAPRSVCPRAGRVAIPAP